MKNLKIIAAIVICSMISFGSLFAQEEKSLAERLQLVEKQNDAFNFYLNMQNRGDILFRDGSVDKVAFRNHQLRLEMRGSISKYVSYRLRHRLNKSNAGQNLDGISKATDIASVTVKPIDNFSITLGKQCAAYGGYEFDLNPIDVYEYSDMIEYMDNFLTGVDFTYTLGKQEIRFQVLDVRSSKFEDYYGDNNGDVINTLGKTLEASKVPFMYTLNWNGNLLDGMIKTRWAYTLGEDAKDQYMNFISLGTQVKINKMFQVLFDWMNSKEDIDRKGIMTSMLANAGIMQGAEARVAADVEYDSYVLKMDIRANKDWNFFLKGTYETADAGGLEDNARVALGYMGGVEYSPFNDNIKFFANYSRRDYSYEVSTYGTDYDTDRFSLGLVYRLKMF